MKCIACDIKTKAACPARPSRQQKYRGSLSARPQWVETTSRPPQNRPMLGNQHSAVREFGKTERDSRMFLNEHQLALVSPDSMIPSYQTLDSQNVFEDLNGVPSTAIQYPNAATNNMLSPTSLQYTPASMQEVAVPTVVEAIGRVTPTVSGSPSMLGNQQLANMEIGITERDSRMFLNEHQLAATQH